MKRNLSSEIWHHPVVVALCNISLVMLLYSAARLFYYLTNLNIYSDVTLNHLLEMMGGGMRFDLTAILYLSSVYLLMQVLPLTSRHQSIYQRIALGLFLIPNTIGILINCADMAYMRFTDRRTTITFFDEFQNDNNLISIFLHGMIDYWYITLFAIISCLILFLCTRKVKGNAPQKSICYYLRESVLMLIIVYFTIIGIRGGFGAYTRPITLSNALQYVNHPNEANIVLNTPFCLMRSTESEDIPRITYYDENEVSDIMTPIHQPQLQEQPRHKNVVIFILESFSKEYIGYYNHDLDGGSYRGFTPFLDSLINVSVTYPLSLASGRKSIDAMPSILSSIPMMFSPYIVTPYSTNDISSIASCLKANHYTTAFFHGAPNGSMGFLAYSKSASFDTYYGLDEYPDKQDYDGFWAIWDEEFLQFYAQQMTQMQQPFMTGVFTATSHHPFQIPKRYEGKFDKGTLPIHQCIGYTDNALRRFFDYARQQPWFDNTLFVITADHTNQLQHAEYLNDKGIFEVPIIFYDPSMPEQYKAIQHTEPVSQYDIMPSVLNYLGYEHTYFAFGQDALTRNKTIPYSVNYNNGLFQIFSDSLLVQFNGNDVVGIYNFKTDRQLENNLSQEKENTAEVDLMTQYLKAFIQQYTHRLIDNKFTVQQ